jgi:hypothetical protein
VRAQDSRKRFSECANEEEISERPGGKREKADLDPPSSACMANMDDRLAIVRS